MRATSADICSSLPCNSPRSFISILLLDSSGGPTSVLLGQQQEESGPVLRGMLPATMLRNNEHAVTAQALKPGHDMHVL